MFLKNIFEWGSLKAGRASDEVKKFFPKMLVLALEFEVIVQPVYLLHYLSIFSPQWSGFEIPKAQYIW